MDHAIVRFPSLKATLIKEGSRALVTGGTGFIGQHLLRKLMWNGCDVTIVDSSNRSLEMVPKEELNLVKRFVGKISEFIETPEFGKSNFDFVFHLAGKSSVQGSIEDPVLDFENGLADSVKLLTAMKDLGKKPLLVFPSSAAVYGEPAHIPIQENDSLLPLSPYGANKLATEAYIAVFCKLYGLSAAIFRPFSVYGPGLRKQVVYETIQKFSRKTDEVIVFGTGDEQRDFIYIDDFLDLISLTCQQSFAPGQFNIINAASGTATKVNELVSLIATLTESKSRISYTGQRRSGDPKTWAVDISKSRELGFTAKWDLAKGVASVLDWTRTKSLND